MKKINYILFILAVIVFTGCEKDPYLNYKTKNVVVIVIDGARYSETWGDSSHTNIPLRYAMSEEGVICSDFKNNGGTYTVSGHTALVTGNYQEIDNSGAEYPQNPSAFQYWLKNSEENNSFAQIIASKDKLEVLSDCLDPQWQGKFRPETDCGINGLGTGYREDSVTFTNSMNVIRNVQPKILLICFKQPDASAHAGDSAGYINAIKKTDEYIHDIWDELQTNDNYKNNTTLIITNDHGRHDYDYTGHGDNCNGCRHIEFLAIGPDFKKNKIVSTGYDLTDIAPTIGELMGFRLQNTTGEVMWDLFEEPRN